MKIEIINDTADITSKDFGKLWTFEFLIVMINAKKYTREKIYIKFGWFKTFIHKFIDEKWNKIRINTKGIVL